VAKENESLVPVDIIWDSIYLIIVLVLLVLAPFLTKFSQNSQNAA